LGKMKKYEQPQMHSHFMAALLFLETIFFVALYDYCALPRASREVRATSRPFRSAGAKAIYFFVMQNIRLILYCFFLL